MLQIVIDGNPWRSMSASILKNSAISGDYPSIEEWNACFMRWERQQIKRTAYEKLSRKRYFAKELKTSLLKLGFSARCTDLQLQEMRQLGYLNDEEGAESLIRRGIRSKKGPAWIRQRLRQKGGDTSFDIENAYPQETTQAIIQDLLIKNKNKGKRAIGVVARKGFSLEEIIYIYNKIYKHDFLI